GRPWSMEQRKLLFQWLRRWGLNCYMYAPKDELKHRLLWREPYTEHEAAQLQSLIAAAREHGVEFIFAISAGQDMVFSSGGDRLLLQQKLRQVAAAGCRSFALLFDDVDPRMCRADRDVFASLAQAQASVANEMYRELGQPSVFLFCPTEYCSSLCSPSPSQSCYLLTLGQELLPGIGIIWTGPKVVSQELSAMLLEEVEGILQRCPIIWDNLYANDYDCRRVFLGPYTGRAPGLVARLRGLLLNPNCELQANFIPIHTLGSWFRSELGRMETAAALGDRPGPGEGSYDPQEALELALRDWVAEINHPGPTAPLSNGAGTSPGPTAPLSDGAETSPGPMSPLSDGAGTSPGPTAPLSDGAGTSPGPTAPLSDGAGTSPGPTAPLSDGAGTSPGPTAPLSDGTGTSPGPMSPLSDGAGTSPGPMSPLSDGAGTSPGPTAPLSDGAGTSPGPTAPLTLAEARMLVELFYLPYQHGPQAQRLLEHFQWLQTNCPGMGSPAGERWRGRARTFQLLCAETCRLHGRFVRCAGRSLLYDLHPYLWDVRNVLLAASAFVRWLGTWLIPRGTLVPPPQRPPLPHGPSPSQALLPVGNSCDLFHHPPPLFPASRLYLLRPLLPADQALGSEVSLGRAPCRAQRVPAPAGRLLGSFLSLSPEYTFVLEDEGGLCGYAAGLGTALLFFHAEAPAVPLPVLRRFPSLVQLGTAPRVLDAGAGRSLAICLLSALRAHGERDAPGQGGPSKPCGSAPRSVVLLGGLCWGEECLCARS
uniref:protein O-GlcNAcase n=1 Tax=Apteryx owenii TaxID=8824 RepID=A0A8B9PQ32_APTOW